MEFRQIWSHWLCRTEKEMRNIKRCFIALFFTGQRAPQELHAALAAVRAVRSRLQRLLTATIKFGVGQGPIL